MSAPHLTRRRALALALATPVALLMSRTYAAAPPLAPGSDADQSKALQAALDDAHRTGKPLQLPAGIFRAQNLVFPASISVLGTPGATILAGFGGKPVGKISSASDTDLRDLGFAGTIDGGSSDSGLLTIESSTGIRLDNCRFSTSSGTGLLLNDAAAAVTGCAFDQLDVAIFSHNSRGLTVTGNRVTNCANGGILIWRDDPGRDASIVTSNHVSGIHAKDGGSGQNGNGINIFRADDVVVSDNVIDDCDFSAVRANSTRNVAIRGNTCTNIREVALYSEFAFSGSVIANNVVDGAAAGISITNLDQGGRLAVCSGNVVRNITANSPTNPDVTPYGIYAEADTVITGNAVSDVPGMGIGAGYGKFLRNVVIADNVVTNAVTGIAVSIVDGVGAVRISGNTIAGAAHALAGMAWDKMQSTDLAADARQFPNVTLGDNTIVS